jgi:opacity protein-like surface antigen
MRKTIHATTVALAALLGSGSLTARAADMSMAPLYQPESGPMVEFGSGWYLRGDVGYSTFTSPNVAGLHVSPTGGAVLTAPATLLDANNHGFGLLNASIGPGYQFNNWFRMDATFEWRQNTGSLQGSSPNTLCNAPSNPTVYYCSGTGTASFGGRTGLLNAYGDLGNWYGVTPYIGAGVGVSRLMVTGSQNVTVSQLSNGVYIPVQSSPIISTISARQDATTFSWALMAGLSYEIAPHVKIDIGYRYLNMGWLNAMNSSGQVSHRTLDEQAVRAGLRFTPDL